MYRFSVPWYWLLNVASGDSGIFSHIRSHICFVDVMMHATDFWKQMVNTNSYIYSVLTQNNTHFFSHLWLCGCDCFKLVYVPPYSWCMFLQATHRNLSYYFSTISNRSLNCAVFKVIAILHWCGWIWRLYWLVCFYLVWNCNMIISRWCCPNSISKSSKLKQNWPSSSFMHIICGYSCINL